MPIYIFLLNHGNKSVYFDIDIYIIYICIICIIYICVFIFVYIFCVFIYFFIYLYIYMEINRYQASDITVWKGGIPEIGHWFWSRELDTLCNLWALIVRCITVRLLTRNIRLSTYLLFKTLYKSLLHLFKIQ